MQPLFLALLTAVCAHPLSVVLSEAKLSRRIHVFIAILDPKAAKVDRVPYLDEVKCTEWSDEQSTVGGVTACWFKVTWQDSEGWVFGGLVCSNPK